MRGKRDGRFDETERGSVLRHLVGPENEDGVGLAWLRSYDKEFGRQNMIRDSK